MTLNDIAIPRSMLRAPDQIGGRTVGDYQRGALVVRGGRVVGMCDAAITDEPQLLIPAPTDPHCHLDKCHTIGRMGPVAGDLATAIEAQFDDKQHWTPDDIRQRATRGLSEARQASVRALRSHVDWGNEPSPPLAWHVLCEIAQDNPDLTLQLSPLVGIELMGDPAFATAIAGHTANAGGALGAFVQGHEKMATGIRQMFHLAAKHGVPLDFHVDEGLGAYNGLEAIADVALDTSFEGPVLCGHAVSLMDRSPQEFARIADKLARAGIAVCALPTTNLYLQDRRAGTPDRRGVTRLRELRAAGVSILTGSDNVADAFCPLGQFDPIAALHLCALAAHLDPPMARWLPMITTDARRAMGLAPAFIEDCPVEFLCLSSAPDTAGFIAGRSPLIPLSVAIESRGGT